MRRRLMLLAACSAFLVGQLVGAPVAVAAPVVDQSVTGVYSLTGTLNACCAYIAQTFTAGVTGRLTGVNAAINTDGDPFPLRVAIRTTDANGDPTSVVLAETTLSRPHSSDTDELIPFGQPPHVSAGVRYAIVVDFPGAPQGNHDGSWFGFTDNPYAFGEALASDDGGSTWFLIGEEAGWNPDLGFRTHVDTGPSTPGSPTACKSGGWRNLVNDEGQPFRNQGQCVSLVASQK
jgi:hypothetical protein